MKTILIMAAGRGSRYGKLKQFDPLGPNGEFLFEFSIHDALAVGFDHVVVVTRKDRVADMRSYLLERLPEGVALDVIPQALDDLPKGTTYPGTREKPWGTAHAVWVAREVINNSFVVINSDDHYGRASMRSAMEFITENRSEAKCALVPYRLSNTMSEAGSVSRAICRVNGKNLLEIEEYTEIEKQDTHLKDLETGESFTGDEVVSMNFWVLSPAVFQLIHDDLVEFLSSPHRVESDELYIPKQVQVWIDQNRMQVVLTPPGKGWFGVTYADDKVSAVQALQHKTEKGIYPSPLWVGVRE